MWIYKLFLGPIHFHSIISYYYGSEWDPRFAWLQTFFEIPSLVFCSKKKLTQVWNNSRVSKWQNFNFSSLSSCYKTSWRILRYGNSFPSNFPEVLLAHASPDDWPIVAKHANMTSSRQYKCDDHDNYIRIFYFTCWICNGYSLQDLRGTNRTAGSSPSLRRLPGPGPRRGGAGRVRLRTLWFAAYSGWGSLPLVGPPSPGGGSAVLPCRRTQRSPHSPVSFPEDCFRPSSNIEGFVSFGHEEGDDAMSMSASEKEDWAGSEPDQLDSSEPSDLQEELMRVLSKAVQELELTWSPPEEPVRSKLDSW